MNATIDERTIRVKINQIVGDEGGLSAHISIALRELQIDQPGDLREHEPGLSSL